METVTTELSKAWMFYKNSSAFMRVITACAIGFISFAGTTSLFRATAPAEAQTSPGVAPNVSGNCNNFGNNNFNCNAVTVAPPRLAFSNMLGQQLLARMPDKTKKVDMEVVGSKSDQAVGDDIYRYLLQSGYQQVDRGPPIGMLMDVQGAPDGPIYVMEDPGKYVLVVKPSAH